MFIKLGIIAGIIILGGMVFSNEIDTFFPTTSATVIDSIKDDVSNIGSKASESVEKRIDESVDKIVDKTTDSITNEISEAGDKITNEISEVKDSSKKIISEEVSNFDPIETIQNLFEGGTNSKGTSTSNPPTPTSTPISLNTPLVYETLSLTTKQSTDENILLSYEDSSGKTKSVSVVLRTEHQELFSGTFFTSDFETIINDSTGIPYFIDMEVDHEDYGTITSSVFNPGDNSDTNINGIFSQS